MLESLYDAIYNLLASETFFNMINNFGAHEEVVVIITIGCVTLICQTISFAFKFLLGLVDR